MAIAATSGNLKQLESRMSNIRKRNEARRTDAEGIAAAINGKAVVIEAKAGDEGKLFGSVTALMIEEAVAAQLGHDVDHKRMDLPRPIKALGEYPVAVSVFGDVKATLTVKVVGEGGAVQAAADTAAVATAEAEASVEPESEDAVAVDPSADEPDGDDDGDDE
jgi:large subunit ribosomal protein L9